MIRTETHFFNRNDFIVFGRFKTKLTKSFFFFLVPHKSFDLNLCTADETCYKAAFPQVNRPGFVCQTALSEEYAVVKFPFFFHTGKNLEPGSKRSDHHKERATLVGT